MVSEVNDILVRHIFKDNNLASNRQRAYRSGHLTEYLLIHLTESWRKALDSGKFVAAAFIDFKKAFDRVSHATLVMKLRRDFDIMGMLLDWLKSYLSEKATVHGAKWNQIRYASGVHWHSPGIHAGPNTIYSIYKRLAIISLLRIAIHAC